MNIVLAQAAVSPAASTLGGQGWRQAGELGMALVLSAAATSTLHVRYPDGHGILRTVINEATQRGFVIDDLATEAASGRPGVPDSWADGDGSTVVMVTMNVHGKRPVSELAGALTELDLVNAVVAADHREADE